VSSVFEVSLSYDDYLASNWLILRRGWLWSGVAKFVLIVGSVITILIAGPYTLEGGREPIFFLASITISFCISIAILATLPLFWRWLIRRNTRKSYAQLNMEGLVTRYEFNESGIVVTNQLGMSNLEWKHILRWMENDDFILLFRADTQFFLIPKRQVDGLTLSALKQAMSDASIPSR
jgi:hypothetical protein